MKNFIKIKLIELLGLKNLYTEVQELRGMIEEVDYKADEIKDDLQNVEYRCDEVETETERLCDNIDDEMHNKLNLEFPEIVDSSEFQRKDEIFQKSLPRALSIITNCEIIKKRISFFYRILEEKNYE